MVNVLEGTPAKVEPAPSTSDPRRQPVDRITWEIYVAVSADNNVKGAPRREDAAAQKHGVIPQTWLAVSSV